MNEYDEAALDNMVSWMYIRRGANARNDKEMAKAAEDSIFAILGMIADVWSPVRSEPLESGCGKLVSKDEL